MIDYRNAIQSKYAELGAKKRRIADYVLNRPQQVMFSSVQSLAKQCRCEQTTIVRFAQQLGFKGYTALKLAIARQTNSPWSDFQEADESIPENAILAKLASRHAETIRKTLCRADLKKLSRIGDLLESSSGVLIFGAGSSHLAALDLNIKLLRLGIRSNCFADPEMSRTFLGYAGNQGLVILFSNSGETSAVVELAKLAKKEHFRLAAVTSFPDSSLARLADILLLTPCRDEPPIRFGVMSSRLAQFTLVDALTLLYSMRDRERSLNFIAKGYHEDEMRK